MEHIEVSGGAEGVTAAGDLGGLSGPREGRAKRRSFTVAYKRAMVAEYDGAPHGAKGAILRRERLYDSHIQEWRAAAAAGTLEHPVKRGRPKGTGEGRSVAGAGADRGVGA